jgi:hypothetical protein
MPLVSSLERLTWGGKAPAPFESAASMFLKIMILNSLTFRELTEIIKSKSTGALPPWPDLRKSAWIDFGNYSALLRVDQKWLKQGFLDWLGFDVFRGKPAGIRHCRECTKLLYHCSLFDLAIVDRCPWHGCRIERSTDLAEIRLQTEGTRKYGWNLAPIYRCSYDLRPLLEDLRTNRVPPEVAEKIDRNCRQLVGWWATVKQKQSGATELLSSIIRTGTFDAEFDERRAVALGFVEQIAPIPRAWRSHVEGTPARAIAYRPRGKETATDETLLKRQFACVRRYLWKRFVRNHRECLKTILRMSEDERQSMDAEYCCSVCVAYLAWLGEYSLERYHFRDTRNRPKDTRSRLKDTRSRLSLVDRGIVPQRMGRDNSLPRFCELALFSFMRGWAAIERKIEHQNLYLYHAEVRTWPKDTSHTVVGTLAAATETEGQPAVIVLRADETLLEERARVRCANRAAQASLMSNVDFYTSYWNVEQTRQLLNVTPLQPTMLFRIKDFCHTHPNVYSNLYI